MARNKSEKVPKWLSEAASTMRALREVVIAQDGNFNQCHLGSPIPQPYREPLKALRAVETDYPEIDRFFEDFPDVRTWQDHLDVLDAEIEKYGA